MGHSREEIPLGELFDFGSGLSKAKADFGSGFGFLSFKDVFYNYFVPDQLEQLVNSTEREQKTCSVKRGDVFLTRTSETQEDLGMSCVALKDYDRATFNGFTKRLRPKQPDRIVPEYAGYFFRSKKFRQDVTAMSSLSTRASLNNEMLCRLKMLLPPKETQIAIGRVLKSFDDKIEINRRMNTTLEAMARALFKAWFVDFEPVHANKENRPSTSASPEIAKLFPSDFENGIPKGWPSKNLGDTLTIAYGKNLPTTRLIESGYPVFGGNGIIGCHSSYLYEAPQVLVACRGAASGKINQTLPRSFVTNNSLVLETGPKTEIGFNYLKHFMLGVDATAFVTGSAQPQVTIENIRHLEILLPPKHARDSFETFSNSMEERMLKNQEENIILAQIRDSLLPRLISGAIRASVTEF